MRAIPCLVHGRHVWLPGIGYALIELADQKDLGMLFLVGMALFIIYGIVGAIVLQMKTAGTADSASSWRVAALKTRTWTPSSLKR